MKGHLCGGIHKCGELCQIDGFCEIWGCVTEKQERFQEKKRKNCNYTIPKNEFHHAAKIHSCCNENHKCGFECIQCHHYCNERFGHNGLHKCFHGEAKNDLITILLNGNINNLDTSISSSKVFIDLKNNRNSKFNNRNLGFCDELCREQGQGHTHLLETNFKINNNDVKLFFQESYYYVYECKCSYFWEKILKFQTHFSLSDKEIFSLCNYICKTENHPKREFCQLSLWHKEFKEKKIPKGTWVLEGHIFRCSHAVCNSIFLVDQSESMNSNSITPTIPDIKKGMNNITGAFIEAILNYCKIRNEIEGKEIISLIGFNDKASLIFENIPIGNNEEIKNNCISKMKPLGNINFLNAFIEAKKILNNINENMYIPIIIFLTNRLGFDLEETLEYIEYVIHI